MKVSNQKQEKYVEIFGFNWILYEIFCSLRATVLCKLCHVFGLVLRICLHAT